MTYKKPSQNQYNSTTHNLYNSIASQSLACQDQLFYISEHNFTSNTHHLIFYCRCTNNNINQLLITCIYTNVKLWILQQNFINCIYNSEFLIFRYCSIVINNSQMQEHINKRVHPGLKITKYNNQVMGYGLYIRDNFVFSSVFGALQSSTINSQTIYSVSNNFPNKKVGISIGDIVYARVLKVKQEECIVQILQVNSISCLSKQGKGLEGAIRKENVRQKMVDSVIMIDSFRPRDIIKAKVLSLGDSLRGMYLTTASENLGVLVAQNQETKRLMLPFDWTTMIDPQELVKQSRKVCKPQ